MAKAFGIVSYPGQRIWVDGLQDYRPIGAFSFLGRYRVIDFPISNMSNSGIDHVQVYINREPRSIVEHLGSGRQYNINSKRGKLHMLFSSRIGTHDLYNTDIASYAENLESIEAVHYPYVVIAPAYMVYTQDYDALLKEHISAYYNKLKYTGYKGSHRGTCNTHLGCAQCTENKYIICPNVYKKRRNRRIKRNFHLTYVAKHYGAG